MAVFFWYLVKSDLSCTHVHWTSHICQKHTTMYNRSPCTFFSAHVHPVCSISWCRNGSKLASASTDNTVSVWDVLTGECDYR